MKRVPVSLVVLFTLAVTQGVRADLRATPGNQSVLTAGTFASALVQPPGTDSRASLLRVDAGDLRAYESMQIGELAGQTVSTEALGLNSLAVEYDVIQLPPAPSSTALFFSAMASIGAWQLVRSSKNLHFGAMPEWYHSGGPVQVGHITAFDLDFTSLPLCLFEEPVGERPFFYSTGRDIGLRRESQHFLSIADPRGPPTLAV